MNAALLNCFLSTLDWTQRGCAGALLLGIVGLATSCTVDQVTPEEPAPAHGQPCKDYDECSRGLVCPQSGALQNRCVYACERDQDCEDRLGPAYACYDGFCTIACGNVCDSPVAIDRCLEGYRCVVQGEIEGNDYQCLSFCVP